MVIETTTKTKTWILSDDDKQVIKENAKDLRDFLKTQGYNTYVDFYENYRCSWYHNWYDFYKFIECYLPFVKEEKPYITMSELLTEIDSAIRVLNKSLVTDKYDKESLIEKIFSYKDDKIINYLLNN